MLSARQTLSLALLASPAALGCAGNVSASGGNGDAEATATHAVVIVERTVDAVGGAHAAASARFVRIPASSSTNEALRAIGAALDLPGPGACVRLTRAAGEATGQAVPVVELSNMGSVSVEVVGGAQTRLVPRQLPDVTDVVSGVVYARAIDATLLPAGSPYAVRVGGAPGVGPFVIAAVAPNDPSDIRIAGEDATGALVSRGPWVDLAWAPDRSDDVIYADVQPAGVRCALASDGATGKDGLAHGGISASLLDESGTLVVHRLRRESMVAPGVDDGEVRFDFARSIAYVRPNVRSYSGNVRFAR